MSICKSLFYAVLLLPLAACATNNGRYAVISTKPVSPYTLTASNGIIARNVTAKDSRHLVIIIPTDKQPTLNDVINQLLDRYQGDYLVNASVTHRALNLMWLYHYNAWEITADVARIYK